MSAFLQDVRYALRTLKRSVGLTTAALAVCIPAPRATRVNPVVALREEWATVPILKPS